VASAARFLAPWEIDSIAGIAVVVDVLRAFTTAAYAFAAGAERIYLAAGVTEALDLARHIPGALVMGEDRGRRPAGFDLPNSPVLVSQADLSGRSLVQRTSAGTRGVIAAAHVPAVFAASLVCATATANAVAALTDEPPIYVLSGRFSDAEGAGADDLLTAELIERARSGWPLGAANTARAVANSAEARRTLALGSPHAHPDDVVLATAVDAFDFAMRVERGDDRQWLTAVR